MCSSADFDDGEEFEMMLGEEEEEEVRERVGGWVGCLFPLSFSFVLPNQPPTVAHLNRLVLLYLPIHPATHPPTLHTKGRG